MRLLQACVWGPLSMFFLVSLRLLFLALSPLALEVQTVRLVHEVVLYLPSLSM